MPYVDFGDISTEVEDASWLEVMPALVRTSLFHGADNQPAVVIVTDKVLYIGGTEATDYRFRRIPLKSVVDADLAGRSLWECVRVVHLDIEGEKRIFICPFTGSLGKPVRDGESMNALLSSLREG
jgi:hypothetical protein